MTTVTIIQQPVQVVTVIQESPRTVELFKSGIYRITQQAIGLVNGINTVFSASVSFDPGSIEVYVNGIKERYFSLVSDTTIQLQNAPKTTGYSDFIELVYLQK